MLSERFDHLFRRLLAAFIRYDDTPRDTANVIRLAAARVELEGLRQEIADERDVMVGLGRSRNRDDFWRTEEAIHRDRLFALANTSS